MHSHLNLQDRLTIECLRRTNNGSFSQILLAGLAWFFLPLTHEMTWLSNLGFALLVGMQGFRLLYISLNYRNYPRLLKSFRFLMGLSVATALIWAILSALAFRNYGLASPTGLIFCINILSYIAGCSYAFASVPRFQKLFIGLVSWPLLAASIFEPSSLWWVYAGLFTAYIVYLLVISKNHASDLIHTYETEALLRSEKEKLRTVLNSVPGFVAMAGPQSDWIESSDSFKKFSSRPVLQEIQIQFRNSGAISQTQEIELTEDQKTRSFVVSFARPQSDENSIVMVGVPIDELKAIRREMELQRSKAEFSARLSTVGEMAGGIAHEVNTPLAIITGTTFQLRTLLEKELPGHRNGSQLLQRLESTAFRIHTIIRNLQYFSRQGDNDPFEDAHVPLIIEKTLQLCGQKFARNNIKLQVDDVPDVFVPARPSQISQVLLHLLNNAFDAVSHSTEKKVELQFEVAEKGLVISVTDSGVGIPLEIRQRIFEPFFTTKEIGQGTGLGLSVSKGIIQDHLGELSVTSRTGLTKFEFSIPWKRPETISKAG